jgi:peptidoglycan/LPS O-acetylase OafA/YrhL
MASIPPDDARGVPRETIRILQAGRALAALAVVAHHSELAAQAFNGGIPAWLAAVLERGYLGVDFFFVLSGFIIYWSSQGKSPRAYARSRARRIYIPYLPIGLAMAAAYMVVPTDHRWDWLSTVTLFPVRPGPALTVAWTLQHEILFYVLFGILFFTGRLKEGLLLWVAAIGMAWVTGIDGGIPLSILNLEFFFGILAAVAVKREIHLSPWLAPLIFGAWLLLDAQRELSVLVGLALTFLIAPLAAADLKGTIRTPQALVFLGAASYSVYLIHNPAISVIGRVTAGLNWWLALPVIFLLATACGCLYHLLYELPALKLKLGKRQRQPAASVTPVREPLP